MRQFSFNENASKFNPLLISILSDNRFSIFRFCVPLWHREIFGQRKYIGVNICSTQYNTKVPVRLQAAEYNVETSKSMTSTGITKYGRTLYSNCPKILYT